MNVRKQIKELEKTIKVDFQNWELLKMAVTHRSYLNEHRKEKLEHNERLEFLGDAVLELIVTEYLYLNLNKPEGELTNLRAALVKGEALTEVAKELTIEKYLLLSRGEKKSRKRSRDFILANCIEAIIGAIFLDKGYLLAKNFIYENIIKNLEKIIKEDLYHDAKSTFQEKAQEKTGITPSYELLSASGPDHEKIFEVGAYLKKDLIATGKGKSKQDAQQEAAEKALHKKNWN